jgi:hypothetical protein
MAAPSASSNVYTASQYASVALIKMRVGRRVSGPIDNARVSTMSRYRELPAQLAIPSRCTQCPPCRRRAHARRRGSRHRAMRSCAGVPPSFSTKATIGKVSLLVHLSLIPGLQPARAVGCVAALGDDPFHADLAGVAKHGLAVLQLDELRIADFRRAFASASCSARLRSISGRPRRLPYAP